MFFKGVQVLLIGLMALGLILSTAPIQAQAPIRIGVIAPLTGALASVGESQIRTLQMLEEEINKEGGVKGRSIELIMGDTAGEPDMAAMATERLIRGENVLAIIGPSRSSTHWAAVNVAEEYRIPLISMAPGIYIAEEEWVFKTAPQGSAVGKIIDYLKWHGIERVAFVNDVCGESGDEQIMLQSAGIEVVDGTFGLMEAQAVICWRGTSYDSAMVAKNMMGMEIPLLLGYVNDRKFIDEFIHYAGDAAYGVIFPVGKLLVVNDLLPDDDPQKEVLLEFSTMFGEKYDRNADLFGGYAWDAFHILLQAISEAGTDPDPEDIREAIENTTDNEQSSGHLCSPPDPS